jgi:2-polyprenyl-3-methyl-5-hydroxy-6-metoxy-1,4-benzoquinol methylase
MKDFWEENAENWVTLIETQSIPSRQVTSPAIINRILDRGFHSILDVGCGEGWIGSFLAPKMEYYGIDGSFGLIEAAKQKNPGHFEQVSYEDLSDRKWNPGRKFDAAVFNFSILDEKITELLRATSELVVSHGTILIQTLRVEKEGWNVEDFKAMEKPMKGTMPWYGRTRDSWFQLFKECQLEVEEVAEPQENGKIFSILFVLRKIS